MDKKRRKRRRTEEFEEEEEEVWSDEEDETRRPMSTGGENVIKMEIRQCVKVHACTCNVCIFKCLFCGLVHFY